LCAHDYRLVGVLLIAPGVYVGAAACCARPDLSQIDTLKAGRSKQRPYH